VAGRLGERTGQLGSIRSFDDPTHRSYKGHKGQVEVKAKRSILCNTLPLSSHGVEESDGIGVEGWVCESVHEFEIYQSITFAMNFAVHVKEKRNRSHGTIRRARFFPVNVFHALQHSRYDSRELTVWPFAWRWRAATRRARLALPRP